MRTIKIDVNDSIYEHIIFFLKNLPSNMVKIYEPKSDIAFNNTKDEIENIFKNSDIVAFKDIKDPVEWQRSLRDEWQ